MLGTASDEAGVAGCCCAKGDDLSGADDPSGPRRRFAEGESDARAPVPACGEQRPGTRVDEKALGNSG
jgi:hypothetical protein